MLRNLGDVFGKNLLRDVFQLRGSAETEAEVPPGNAKRIDVWFVPDKDKLTDAPEFTELLDEMTAEPSALELWSDAPSEDDFHVTFAKRENFRETLEHRDKRPWVRPMLWHICAGRPKKVIEEFGFEAADSCGRYGLRGRGWRVQIVVVSELPRTRSTLLFRLLGRDRTRREAMRQLQGLPDDAWEKQLAYSWIARVGLESPVDTSIGADEREFVMDARAWFKEYMEKHDREVEARVWQQFEAQRAEERRQIEAQQAEERRQIEAQRAEERRQIEAQQHRQLEHLFIRRIGRALRTAECELLAVCVRNHGFEHVMDRALELSGSDLTAWLEANGHCENK